uniref:Heat shock 70 kDa protein, putative n=1 Tax=Neospora caninum (strain Liverpool) TaxID=572307 RepID=A0A0F7UDQ8_NEOCL|nr:TPA: Heat shock 70 kDa protein, putative [Neospora caninum Liverpool]
MAVVGKGSDLVLGVELGSQMSVVATGTRDDAARAVNEGGLGKLIARRFVPTSIAYAGKVRLFGEEAEARVNEEPRDTIMELPLWISVHTVDQVKALEARLSSCPAVEVGVLSNGELLFHVDFDNQKLKIPVPVAVGAFVGRLYTTGMHQGGGCAKEQNLSGYDFLRHMQHHPRVPHTGVLVVPSSVTEKDLGILTAAQGVANVPSQMLSRMSALINWWCCEKLPAEYNSLMQLQRATGASVKEKGVVHVALLDVGFSEISMAVMELRKTSSEQDTSVVRQPQKQVSVKVLWSAAAGDIGILDAVNVLAKHVRHHIKEKFHEDVRTKTARYWRICQACATAIRALCDVNHASIDLKFLLKDTDFRFNITRKHFGELCAPLQAKLKTFMEETLSKAGVTGANVAAADVLNSLARTAWIHSTIADAVHCDSRSGKPGKIRWVEDGGAGAVLGAVYWAADKKYVDNLVDRNPPYPEDQLLRMTALETDIRKIERGELERRFLLAHLESYAFEMHRAATTKDNLVRNAEQLTKVIKETETSAGALQEAPLEKVKQAYETFRSYLMNSEPRLFEAVEDERATRLGQAKGIDPRKAMDIVVRQLGQESNSKLPNTILLKRAKRDTEEASELLAGGQTDLAVYLANQSLGYLSNMDTATARDTDRRAVTELQLQNYLQLSKAQTKEAVEDRAIDYRSRLLTQALDNCNRALAIDSKNADALFQRSITYMTLNDFSRAKADVEAGLAIVPGSEAGRALEAEITQRQQSHTAL